MLLTLIACNIQGGTDAWKFTLHYSGCGQSKQQPVLTFGAVSVRFMKCDICGTCEYRSLKDCRHQQVKVT
jgi:hypothetical protein